MIPRLPAERFHAQSFPRARAGRARLGMEGNGREWIRLVALGLWFVFGCVAKNPQVSQRARATT